MNTYINPDIILAIDEYHERSLYMQNYYFKNNSDCLTKDELKEKVNDDLIFNVPIYDVLDRRFAAFSSFPDALFRPDDDPKKNSVYFPRIELEEFDWVFLFYLFRLCGSGINYVPKFDSPIGSHGFGNFWIVDCIKNNKLGHEIWLEELIKIDKPFTNNKGYLLPQFSFKHLSQGHLKYYILNYSLNFVRHIFSLVTKGTTIIEAVDAANMWLIERGFKKQNFVLSATIADIAEYFPNYVDQNSMIYAGTNAKKCIRAIFKKPKKYSDLEYESECIQFLADRYNSTPYSVEDSRLCDVVRYFKEYQSIYHVANNKNKVHTNNCILKKIYGPEKYYEFAKNL